MESEFWHQRWRNNEIGFHEDDVHPLLERHWNSLDVAAGARVFVPLCGKSLDMAMLHERGHEVVGIDLSPLAIDAFFSGQGLSPQTARVRGLERRTANRYDLLVGDIFALRPELLGRVDAVYDRASLIALPPDMRVRYATLLRELLPSGIPILLITLEYRVSAFDPPPFSVTIDDVETLFGGWCSIERRETAATQVKGHPGQETALVLTVA